MFGICNGLTDELSVGKRPLHLGYDFNLLLLLLLY